MTQFVITEGATGRITGAQGRPDPVDFTGIPDLRPFPREGRVFHAWQGALDFAQPTPTSEHRWTDAGPQWVEVGALDDCKATAVAKTYPDVDAVYDAAIGRRGTEYARAEEEARAYLAAAVKPAVVSGYISGHAQSNPTGRPQTDGWAARQIIERADTFRWAELQMRNVRFDRQADMRAATTHAELAAAVVQWDEFITWLRATLGL